MDAVSQFLEGEQIYFQASSNPFYSFFEIPHDTDGQGLVHHLHVHPHVYGLHRVAR
jgi:hypothetical protein